MSCGSIRSDVETIEGVSGSINGFDVDFDEDAVL